jgi:hypothetical protein
MKTQIIHIFALTLLISVFCTSSGQAQFAGGNDRKFDYLRIGNPMPSTPIEITQLEIDEIDIESWMLTPEGWNSKKQVVCKEAEKVLQTNPIQNIMQEIGISNETLLIFTVAFLAMLLS